MKITYRLLAVVTVTLLFASCNLLTAAGISSQGQPTKKVEGQLSPSTLNSAVNVDHSQFDQLLKKYVNDKGFVDYKGFQSDKNRLEDYLNKLSQLEPNNDWSVQELLAYYINLYNAATIELILENYPTKSIQDIESAFTKAFIKIGDQELSLGGIENGVLRKMNEPRIHFAINCASYSCPKLMKEAYTATKINEQLEAATVEFINSKKNEISKTNPKLSKIFDFYTSDFKVDGKKDLIGFINQYSNIKIDENTTYTFKAYNWNLNEQN